MSTAHNFTVSVFGAFSERSEKEKYKRLYQLKECPNLFFLVAKYRALAGFDFTKRGVD